MSANIPQYLIAAQYAQLAYAEREANEAVLKGGFTTPRYSYILSVTRQAIQTRYNRNLTDPTLQATGEFMYALSGGVNTTPNTVTTPFLIIIQPNDTTVTENTNVSFSVTVAGGVAPYSYQWYYNGNVIGGATSSSYSITPAILSSAGQYVCKITDSTGQILTSNPANLVVNAAAITGFGSYGDVDPNTDLQAHIDNFTYQESFSITHNTPISVPIPQAGSSNKYWIIKVPSTESDKVSWANGPFNFGSIPDAVFQSLITFGGFDYYYTRVAASFDYTIPLILS